MTLPLIKRALISVSDKSGIVDMAQTLQEIGVEIISTGGTASMLADNGIEVIKVADITGMAEMLDGRIKTLHPKIHGGILARRDDSHHLDDLKQAEIVGIDLVVVNLYPFGTVLKRLDAGRRELVENIDIGGPAMIRGAAKNHDFVTTLTDADDYQIVLDEITQTGGVAEATRQRLAAKAFAHTAGYDAAIAAWMREEEGEEMLPEELCLGGTRLEVMRYGENPHQRAGLYRIHSRRQQKSVLASELVQGKPLSFNNINDADAAFELVSEFDDPAIAIIKHANPCGVACAFDGRFEMTKIWQTALAADPVSAFGGIVAMNRPLDPELALEITRLFTELVIAPEVDSDALAVMARKPDVRLLVSHGMADPSARSLVFRSVAGGFLAQTRDNGRIVPSDLKCVTKRAPSEHEVRDLIFAMTVAKHLKSNAIVYAKDEATVGIGAGQMSRLDAGRLATLKADDATLAGSVVASDAFFPFADGLMVAIEAGASAVIQPGGSRRDDEVIAAADDAGIAMVFTGIRHFRH